jgi:hypothetical protein
LNLGSHFKVVRPDAGPEPEVYAMSCGLRVVLSHGLKEYREYASGKAPPSRMGSAHQAAVPTGDKHR